MIDVTRCYTSNGTRVNFVLEGYYTEPSDETKCSFVVDWCTVRIRTV